MLYKLKYLFCSYGRITGLDPAGPSFYLVPSQGIKGSDASLVDIIHTDAGKYGATVNTGTGTIDFLPNGGRRPQPGCPATGGIKYIAGGITF